MKIKAFQVVIISLLIFLFIGCKSDYDKGYSSGYSSGESNGYSQGRESGYNNGYSTGKQEGYLEGKIEGIREGKKIGYQSGYTVGKKDGRKEKFNEAYYKGYLDKSQNLEPQKNLEVSTVFTPYMTDVATYIFVILGILLSLLAIVLLLKRNLTIKNKISEISFITISIFIYYKFIETNFIDTISLFINQFSETNILIISFLTIIISYIIISTYVKIIFFTPISHIIVEIVGLIISIFILLSNITFLLNWQMIASLVGNIESYIYILISFSLGIFLFFGFNYKKIFK
jgi:hypothetical protein